jgi:hypothetical protein
LRRKNKSSTLFFGLFAVIVAGVLYLYNSSMFERNAPVIKLDNNGFWNLKSPLHLKIQDQSGIKNYRIVLVTAKGEKEIANSVLVKPQKKIDLEIKAPRSVIRTKDTEVKIIITAQDVSKWNFFNGNVAHKEYSFSIDKKRPKVSILANSYKITRGGSALVVFRAQDPNIDEIYIKTNYGKIFKPTPFYKDGYFISLLAWPIQEKDFRAEVIVSDLAGNKVKSYIPLYLKNKRYKISRIKISDKFLQGKIADLASEFDETEGVDDPIEQFKIINEKVRAKNEDLIHSLSAKVPEEMIDSFSMHTMYPLKNAQVVASFGDHRFYYYKGKKVSESYHMGLDLASKAMAEIKPQNGGEVVFADYNGLYGNMPLIHHGLGLYTLYGHCSSVMVSQGDSVVPRQVIARTGKSGYAMGDHLHFGVLVQGIEVRPQEWMDKKWIKLNITKVIKEAKTMIDKSE